MKKIAQLVKVTNENHLIFKGYFEVLLTRRVRVKGGIPVMIVEIDSNENRLTPISSPLSSILQ